MKNKGSNGYHKLGISSTIWNNNSKEKAYENIADAYQEEIEEKTDKSLPNGDFCSFLKGDFIDTIAWW